MSTASPPDFSKHTFTLIIICFQKYSNTTRLSDTFSPSSLCVILIFPCDKGSRNQSHMAVYLQGDSWHNHIKKGNAGPKSWVRRTLQCTAIVGFHESILCLSQPGSSGRWGRLCGEARVYAAANLLVWAIRFVKNHTPAGDSTWLWKSAVAASRPFRVTQLRGNVQWEGLERSTTYSFCPRVLDSELCGSGTKHFCSPCNFPKAQILSPYFHWNTNVHTSFSI